MFRPITVRMPLPQAPPANEDTLLAVTLMITMIIMMSGTGSRALWEDVDDNDSDWNDECDDNYDDYDMDGDDINEIAAPLLNVWR